jgi:hypothetical protein
MNPNNLFADIKCNSVQKQTILGMVIPEKKQKQKFVLLNFGSGNARVSGGSGISEIATNALYEQWNNSLTFNDVVSLLGADIVLEPGESDYNFSLDVLEKDSFIKVFQ